MPAVAAAFPHQLRNSAGLRPPSPWWNRSYGEGVTETRHRRDTKMTDLAGTVVESFLVAWEHPHLEEFLCFFSEDAVFEDGARQRRCQGIDAIKSELEEQMTFGSVVIDVNALVSDGRTVMVERVDRFDLGGKPVAVAVVGVFEVNASGRISRWREYYDLKSISEQLQATDKA
jgi:limonene-1,2-epoxide hydrolase